MVTIVIRKNLVKKAAGVSVACALTIGMNVVIAGERLISADGADKNSSRS